METATTTKYTSGAMEATLIMAEANPEVPCVEAQPEVPYVEAQPEVPGMEAQPEVPGTEADGEWYHG